MPTRGRPCVAQRRGRGDLTHRRPPENPSSHRPLRWPQGGRRIEGRGALREYFGSRPADRLSRRMCTNILVTVDSPTTATATSYFATYRVDGYTGGMLPPRLPANVGHYEDTFRKENGAWLLATRTTFLPFGGPTERVSPPGRP